ncbi:MAG: sigma 54-interacting transcriptional regulator [Sandaracinaceae bacterium]|nr:sigma 54-interacting transcriptional regulator [Sandaracinaceae bacterium]
MPDRPGATLTAPGRALGQVLRDVLVLRWTDEDGAHELRITEPTVIGSAEAAGVRVADRTVSRLHAEIAWRDGAPWVRDLGSRNGTYVDDLRVDGAQLGARARVRVGTTVFEVSLGEEPQRVFLWPTDAFGPLRGTSAPMRELFARLSRIARTDSTALVVGETGTGKELIARAMHEASARAGGPFITVDCTALPEALFESELFGHARGAFTGASGPREGAIEAASGGTLFLDEIGELPAAAQPKLLRVLEEKTVRRVGESEHRPVDVRFVAATHRDLAALVGVGGFREDLYFRLAVIVVDVPPLRARREDIGMLAQGFLPEGAEPLTADTLAWLQTQPWPGNVRELRNFVDRSVALGVEEARAQSGEVPARATTLPSPDLDRPFKDVRDEWLAHLEREVVRGWLGRTGGNVKAAAEAMGLNRTYLHRLMKKHGLDR